MKNSLLEEVCQYLDGPIEENENLIERGLSSLQVMRLINTWRKCGVRVTFGQLMELPTLQAWGKLLKQKEKVTCDSVECVSLENKENKICAMTDVQYAYWIGRQKENVLSTSCHAYFEFDGKNIDCEKIKNAWNKLQMQHAMLRCKFTKEGKQIIEEHMTNDEVQIYDLRNSESKKSIEKLQNIRKKLSNRDLDIWNGKVAGLTITLLPENKHRVHFDIDLLVSDVQSISVLLRDLARFYDGENLEKDVQDWNFGNYLKIQEKQNCDKKALDKQYWLNKLPDMSGAPQLPLAKKEEDIESVLFHRRELKLDKKQWDTLKMLAAKQKVTPAIVLMTAYAMVIERWSENKKFLLNVPLFNRDTKNAIIEDVVADFTTLVLLDVDFTKIKSFQEHLNEVKDKLYEAVEHAAFSAVEVQRELRKLRGEHAASAPIVFACNVGSKLLTDEFEKKLGVMTYMVSQTPQVWIDFQSYEQEDGVLLTWDVVEELFPEGMIAEMFAAFGELLRALTKTDWKEKINVFSKKTREQICEEVNNVQLFAKGCLHDAFVKMAKLYPNNIAVKDLADDKKYTYWELYCRAKSVAQALTEMEISNEAIAFVLPRGYLQIVAIYGILMSGNHYVPISQSQPLDRVKKIVNSVKIRYIISENNLEQIGDVTVFHMEELMPNGTKIKLPEVKMEQTAYIIMTSGSTGLPKGVEIAHGSAWNTIAAVNTRYDVKKEDIALAISAVDFDLSVYDIFGILGVGGTLITIPERYKKDAYEWKNICLREQVTVWNSVPAYLEMLLVTMEDDNRILQLKKVFLSGDWISLEIPAKLDRCTKSCVLSAMGGATEASIWSNVQDVTLPIPKEWHTIPYGRPLPGQLYRVVDEKGQDCPAWVKGELWIGGFGLAKGYVNDRKKTSEHFIEDDYGRWYRTGDYGRKWNNQVIEFLGRTDNQVKLHGFRIELGEVNQAVEKLDGVNKAVSCMDTTQSDGQIITFIEPDYEGGDIIDERAERKDAVYDIHNIHMKKLAAKSDEKMYLEYKQYLRCKGKDILREILREVHFDADMDYDVWFRNSGIAQQWKEIVYQWGKEIQVPEKENLGKESFEGVDTYYQEYKTNITKVLRGELDVLTMFYGNDRRLAPTSLLKTLPGMDAFKESFLEGLKDIRGYLEKKKKRIRILEIGTRDAYMHKEIAKIFENLDLEYIYADVSIGFVEDIKKLETLHYVQYTTFDEENESVGMGMGIHEYDLIIAFHSLHRQLSKNNVLNHVNELLDVNGILYFSERTEHIFAEKLTIALLEREASLLSAAEWRKKIEEAGLADMTNLSEAMGNAVFVAIQQNVVKCVDKVLLHQKLSLCLPEYMIPSDIIIYAKLPLTNNGKIDRKRLMEKYEKKSVISSKGELCTDTERNLASMWKELFGKEIISNEENFFLLGGDSLIATRLVKQVAEVLEKKISIKEIFDFPKLKLLANCIDAKKEEKTKNKVCFEPDEKNQYVEFPLTDVQKAYWIGRSGLYDLGGVSTHCYYELDCENLDIDKAETAWNKLIKRHAMMRAIVQDNGNQRVLEKVPFYRFESMDICDRNPEYQSQSLMKRRENMSHQVIEADQWPLFDIKATRFDNNKVRLHISFDNLIFDGWSMFSLLEEWSQLYRGDNRETKFSFTFRDYVNNLERCWSEEEREKDKQYWENRIFDISLAPKLPLRISEKEIKEQKFVRREKWLSANTWGNIKKLAQNIEVTPTVFLVGVFAQVLRRWSENKSFTINLTQFKRKEMHEDVKHLIGDFTELTLLECKDSYGITLEDMLKKTQKQLVQDLQHDSYSMIEFERKLLKERELGQSSVMPIVFTSGLGMANINDSNWLGTLTYNISQTPQVWIDHQVIEKNGGLLLTWDSLEELFYPGMLDEMFQCYETILEKLAVFEMSLKEQCQNIEFDQLWKTREMVNQTRKEEVEETLTEFVLEAMQTYPECTAIIDGEQKISYKQLYEESLKVACLLKRKGVEKQDTVGILLKKGWKQIASVLGVLFAGGIYLPLDIHNPKERIEKILKSSETSVVITERDSMQAISDNRSIVCIELEYLPEAGEFEMQKSNREDIAYIIYTSGTTGTPKGVMISHVSAMNTILDVNARWNVSSKDTVFAISQLHFDLSVYDIFGILGVGGTMVIPSEEGTKSPENWRREIEKNHITIWNSVPAIVELLMDYKADHDIDFSDSDLRVVLMSGDWVPINLPKKIYDSFSNVKVVALGGATEAAIWSNYFEVPYCIPSEWKSIPYGKPLANQRYYILDDKLEHCPNWVSGQLYIGGSGLAQGYLNDEQLTSEKFIWHEKLQERLYATGDMGRYWENGDIEFLGRKDFQVKINGYRVELGELEHAIIKSKQVKECIALYDKERACLRTFVVPFHKKNFAKEELLRDIQERVPFYMVPKDVVEISAVPLTGNGKVDRKKLMNIPIFTQEQVKNLPKTEEEIEIAEIWESILGIESVDVERTFFELGGDSIKIIKLVNSLNQRYDMGLTITDVSRLNTVRELAGEIKERNEGYCNGVI